MTKLAVLYDLLTNIAKRKMAAILFDTDNEKADEIVWGIRVQRTLKREWKLLAGAIGVPAKRLVAYVLDDWFKKNNELFREKEGIAKLSQLVLSRTQSANHKIVPDVTSKLSNGSYETSNLKTNLTIRGVSLDTRLRLKVMALGKGIPIYRLFDEIVDKVWQKEEDKIPKRYISSYSISKEVRKTFRKQRY